MSNLLLENLPKDKMCCLAFEDFLYHNLERAQIGVIGCGSMACTMQEIRLDDCRNSIYWYFNLSVLLEFRRHPAFTRIRWGWSWFWNFCSIPYEPVPFEMMHDTMGLSCENIVLIFSSFNHTCLCFSKSSSKLFYGNFSQSSFHSTVIFVDFFPLVSFVWCWEMLIFLLHPLWTQHKRS